MIDDDVRSRIRRLFLAEHWKIHTISTELGVHHDGAESKSTAKRCFAAGQPNPDGRGANEPDRSARRSVGNSGQQPGADEHGVAVKRGRRARSRTQHGQPEAVSRLAQGATGRVRVPALCARFSVLS